MASVRQADTALWLHNKLSTDDSWSGSSLRSLLTQDVLRNIPECFHRLETQVKVKLLMAFLHLPRRVMEETSSEMCEVFEIGSQDEDEWVRVLSEILKYYPSTGMLNVQLGHVSPVFAEVAEEIKKTVAGLSDGGSSLLPLECLYLNRTALVAMVGPQPPLPKHFTLRRKPKSAALRAELTQKASEAISAQKKGLGTSLSSGHKLQSSSKKFEAPVRVTPRMSNTSSFRPTPSRATTSSGSSRSIISAATLKHHGRTKLLDINEQPIGGGRELKRRKKLAESEQGEEAKHKKVDNPKPLEPSTPDYAAGLAPVAQPNKPPSSPEPPSSSMAPPSSTPSYAPQAASTQAPSADTLSESTINLKRELEMHMEQQRQLMMRERQQKQAAAAAAMAASSSSSSTPAVSDSTRTPAALSPGATNTQQQQQQQQQAKRQLTLTRDQMLAAHEMFKNANRVSRAEKALILGFMAGAREKPYAHQGPIITIKLSENTETVTASDGTQQMQLVEMLFEMNYDSGHWRRLKRTRVVSKHGASATPAQKTT
ncbi:negative elongation factor A-like [Oculina patagonica]